METFLTLLFSGLSTAALYYLLAAGLSLSFGLLRVLNFAHGAVFVWGGYTGMFVYQLTHSLALAVLAGTLLGGALGWVLERTLLRPAYGNIVVQVLTTLGAFYVLSEAIKIPFGPDQVGVGVPAFLHGAWMLRGVAVVKVNVLLVSVGLLVWGLGLVWLTRTRLGLIVRAGIDNPEMVMALGIPIRRVFTAVFAAGAALAALGGVLAGQYFGALSPDMGLQNMLNAFIVVVVGGLGSYNGTAVGALLVGLIGAFASYYLPSQIVGAVNVLIMALVLIFRPEGLFGEKEVVV